jgi:hypothetical protein
MLAFLELQSLGWDAAFRGKAIEELTILNWAL